MAYLSWISDHDLIESVKFILHKASEAKASKRQNISKNVIDPFSAIFQIGGFNLNYDSWLESEINRQTLKSFQNHVGTFHQRILGSVDGWEDLQTGSQLDIVSTDKKIIAEIKNKHNTLTGGKQSGLYREIENLVMPNSSKYKGFTGYYVVIVPKTSKPFNKEWTPSDKAKGSRCPSNSLIRAIDGDSFYELVSGQKNAIEQLYAVLPAVISKLSSVKISAKEFDQLHVFFKAAFG